MKLSEWAWITKNFSATRKMGFIDRLYGILAKLSILMFGAVMGGRFLIIPLIIQFVWIIRRKKKTLK